ncbi:EAL domain-containing protein [Methylophaga sp. OBS3]|uniref:EAL domain-containing protein n=1 Tax=Methylophaga sp. OBS3 TaxID=2991934 RepID=UPI00225B5ECD|nr:EAL domain-containing protein [Methylophaga sp. OBS3]MCX4188877.1 EAL domain-containing protein [Methylophaga sp. OBS3]
MLQTAIASQAAMPEALSNALNNATVSADYRQLTLHSHFQPIFSISHRRPVGYEGLIRCKNKQGENLSPVEVLRIPQNSHDNLALDRLCRRLHMHNFSRQDSDEAWLFLNLNSQCLVAQRPDAGFMQTLFDQTGIPAHRIVIEILESEIQDREYLKDLIIHFRSLGCLIAIDDFGAGHSNFDRIWELAPDIVKIDRSLIYGAGQSSRVERILTGIVSLIHEAGSLVIIEGVETEQEALIAIASNADMVQGFYFGKPQPSIKIENSFAATIDTLLADQQSKRFKNSHRLNLHYKKIETLFRQAVNHFAISNAFDISSNLLFQDKRAVRCYLLDEAGYQMAKNVYSPNYQQQLDKRYTPLLSGDNANWSHKHYHFRAIEHPGQMQFSRPYLSVADSRMCITVSQTVVVDDKLYVFCCDLDWQDGT